MMLEKQNRTRRKPRARESRGDQGMKIRIKQVLKSIQTLGCPVTVQNHVHVVAETPGLSHWLSDCGCADVAAMPWQ